MANLGRLAMVMRQPSWQWRFRLHPSSKAFTSPTFDYLPTQPPRMILYYYLLSFPFPSQTSGQTSFFHLTAKDVIQSPNVFLRFLPFISSIRETIIIPGPSWERRKPIGLFLSRFCGGDPSGKKILTVSFTWKQRGENRGSVTNREVLVDNHLI